MKILSTHQISAAIIDIIDESKEYCYLISPYVEPWILLERALDKAARQKKRITFIVRFEDGPVACIKRLHEKYEFEFIALDFLHAKVYCNERCALITSMNLYDGSQKRNHEIGVLFPFASDANTLLKEYILEDILSATPRLHLQGYFHSDDLSVARQMSEVEQSITKRGYCVVCGAKIDLDKQHVRAYPKIVRCNSCYFKNAYPDKPPSVRIRYCHYCGGEHDSTLIDPFHLQCRDRLEGYLNWIKCGRRGEVK